MRALLYVIVVLTAFASAAVAKTSIVVLPPDYPGAKDALMRQLADAVVALRPGERIIVYAARPLSQLASIALPDDPNLNRAMIRRKLAQQFEPVMRYLAGLAAPASGEPPGNLMIPNLLDEMARNVIPALPEKRADILLIGSLFYFDRRDSRWSMTDRFYRSDGLLRASRAETPFGVSGAQTRLAGVTLHFCWPSGDAQFVSTEHEEVVRRFWSLWTTEQSGRVGTFSYDLASCWRRFLGGETSGQVAYKITRDAKPEMLRIRAPVPATLPENTMQPGEYFLRDDVPISHTPPAKKTGVTWIGLKWHAPCDLDLYARPDSASQWLFFGHVRTLDGYFNKDFLSATGEGQFEFIELNRAIDLNKVEVAINLYRGNLAAGPEGIIRVWFAGRVYEAPFKIAARTGNRGALPMSGAHWLRVDLRRVVGLAPS